MSLESFVTESKGREGLSQLGGMLFARACSGTVQGVGFSVQGVRFRV